MVVEVGESAKCLQVVAAVQLVCLQPNRLGVHAVEPAELGEP